MKTEGHVLPRDFKVDMPTAVRGEGIYIYDDTGKRYLDGCSGALISSIGHCIPQVTAAISQQLQRLDFAHPSRWRNPATEEAARALAEITPGDLNYIWFVSGGSEAVESAIKLARQYFIEKDGSSSGKHLIAGRWNSYHGATLGTMAVGGNMARRRIFSPMFKEHPKISPHYCYRCAHDLEYPGCKLRCAHELEDLIQREGAANIAAFIAEPIVGSSAGALVPPDEYWPLIREICSRYDVLLIADEIMTGIGRTGKAFCVDHWGVIPDIIVSAKSMAAGYVPTGGIFVKEAIALTIEKGSGHFQHGYTYNANPVSAAAVTAVLTFIKEHHLIENAETQGKVLEEQLARLTALPIVGDVRGKGLMWGIELVADRTTKEPFPGQLSASRRVAAECMKRGLVVYPGGGMVNGVAGDNLLVAPPLIVNEDQIKEIVSIFQQGLAAASDYLLKGL